MGILICPRCKSKTEADSIEEGRSRLDHARGLYLGKSCYDGLVELSFIGTEKKTNVTTSEKPYKSNPLKNLKDKLITSTTKKSDSKSQ